MTSNPYHLPVTNRRQFEEALDGRRLWIKENWKGGPRWYLVRRNGRTRTWLKKSNAHRWEIPIKYKLNACLTVGDFNIEILSKSLKASPGPDWGIYGDSAREQAEGAAYEAEREGR